MVTTILQSVEETIALGKTLAASLRRGDVLALCGGLGAGKTHFIKGVAAGLESADMVTSPTFTLLHEYLGGRLPLYHFDFYRLDDEDEALRIGLDEYLDGDGITAIEWADKFPALLPLHTRWFHFVPCADGTRELREV